MWRFISCVLCSFFLSVPLSSHMVQAQNIAEDSVTTTTVVSTQSTYVYDLVADPSECVNSNPRPNCGKKPELSGDRGGPMQYAVFFTMLGAVGIIATVIVRNIIRRDRAIAESMKKTDD